MSDVFTKVFDNMALPRQVQNWHYRTDSWNGSIGKINSITIQNLFSFHKNHIYFWIFERFKEFWKDFTDFRIFFEKHKMDSKMRDVYKNDFFWQKIMKKKSYCQIHISYLLIWWDLHNYSSIYICLPKRLACVIPSCLGIPPLFLQSFH